MEKDLREIYAYYIYAKLNHSVVHLKLTHYCTSTIFQ